MYALKLDMGRLSTYKTVQWPIWHVLILANNNICSFDTCASDKTQQK